MQGIEGSQIVLEGHPDITLDILTWYFGEAFDHAIHEIKFRGMVHPVHVVRHPAGVTLGAYQLQLGMALEDTAQHHEPNDILDRADDAKEIVNLMPTMR